MSDPTPPRPERRRELPVYPWSSHGSVWRPRLASLPPLVVGQWLFGTGEALLVASRLGNSPWTVLSQGIALHSPLSIGAANFVIGGLLLLGFRPLRERIGLGTVANIVIISIAIDVMLPLLPVALTVGPGLVEVLVGVALEGVGSTLYLSARLGPGPRDGLMTGLHRRTGRPIYAVRAAMEGTVLVLGWLLGGRVGIGTVLFALFIGPTVGGGLTGLHRVTRPRGDAQTVGGRIAGDDRLPPHGGPDPD